MIDILPTLALCTSRVSPDIRLVRLWALVLAARRVEYRAYADRLLTPPGCAQQAVAEILAFERENILRPRPLPLPDNSWISLLVLLFFVLASSFLDSSPVRYQRWEEAGQANSGLILAGQWWRAVTALFLHADAGHLLSNVAATALLAPLLARRRGSGVTWFFFLLTGVAGNMLNACVQPPEHLSIGASTGVFGLIGVLAGGVPHDGTTRASRLLLSLGFALSFLALLGAGGERVDLGAHFFGLCAGLLLGLCPEKNSKALNLLAGLGALTLAAGAWILALSNIR